MPPSCSQSGPALCSCVTHTCLGSGLSCWLPTKGCVCFTCARSIIEMELASLDTPSEKPKQNSPAPQPCSLSQLWCFFLSGASRAPGNGPMSQLAALPGPVNSINRNISAPPPPGWGGNIYIQSLSAAAVAAGASSLLHHTAGSHHHHFSSPVFLGLF